jgi:hypothetical protein
MATTTLATQASRDAMTAVGTLIQDHEEACDLLMECCDDYYWIKDHPDFQHKVRAFLEARGYSPHPYHQKP